MKLTPKELGNHFIVGLSGPSLLESERRLLGELQPLGIILFRKNILPAVPESHDINSKHWVTALKQLISEARQAAERDDLIVSIDHEGGRVHRFSGGVTKFPPAATFGQNARSVGASMGKELRALGIRLDFAPVCDVHSETKNTVIGDRAFGRTPEEVSRLSCDFLHGLQSEGVIGCAKHFPGHGATEADSHFELPHLALTKDEIFARELPPFRAIIEAGVLMVMSAHVLYRNIDNISPATFSSIILRNLLRAELGFSGVTISDDLEMKALSTFTPAEKASIAVNAGIDILLEANPSSELALDVALKMARGLSEAISSNMVLQKHFAESAQRVDEFRIQAGQIISASPSEDLEFVGCDAHQHLAAMLTPGR